MTATLYPPRRTDRVAPRPIGQPDYTVRRVVAVVIAVVVVFLVAMASTSLVGALADLDARPVAASDTSAASSIDATPRVYVAQPGDTLWSIADRHRGEIGHDRFVDALIALNGGTGIQVGQAIRLP